MKLVLLDDDGHAVSELSGLERYDLICAVGRSQFLDDAYWLVRDGLENQEQR